MKNSVKNVKRTASKSRPKQVRVVSSPRQAPVSSSSVIKKLGRPKVTNLGEAGDILVIHREYISDLLSSATAGAFAIAGIPINPGNIAMFPWLSGIASNFESYVFRGLKFLFETSAPTSTPGTVLMAVDYDKNDPLPSDKSVLMSLRDATRSAAWERNHLECNKEDLHKRKTYYVAESNTTGLPIAAGQSPLTIVGQDDRLDDVGEFLIASSNSTADASLGELYVEYEVALMTPQGNSTPQDYYFAEIEDADSSSSVTAANPWGSDATFLNSTAGRYIYPGLNVVYCTGAGASYFLFTRPGTYSYAITFANTTSVTSVTISSDVVGGNARYNTSNVVNSTGTSTCSAGIFVIRNITPDTFAGSVNSFTGYVGYISAALGALSKSSYVARIRISRLPDYDSNQSVGTGYVGLKPPARMTSRMRRSRKYSAEPLRLDVSNVAGNRQDCSESEKTESEEPRQDITATVGPVIPKPKPPVVRGVLALPGTRSSGY